MRSARPTTDIRRVRDFYEHVVGLRVLWSFNDHDGYDGVVFGLPDETAQLELVKAPHDIVPSPTIEDALILSPPNLCGPNEAGVDYVVVGGFAAVLHGSPLPTADVDVVADRFPVNLARLAEALQRLDARLRTEAGPVEVPLDAGSLRAVPHMLDLVTDAGDLDLTFEPAGLRQGFDAWNEDASDVVIGDGLTIRLASLASVIDSKRAADREKDRRALPYLESLLEQITPNSEPIDSRDGDNGKSG